MRQLKTACTVLGVFSVLLGLVYPLLITGIAQALFPFRANGSFIRLPPVGSELIGQSFSAPGYFHGRPSDCGYDAAGSSSANLGPSNPALFLTVRERIDSVRVENGLDKTAPVPADLVLASASGLDPDISPPAALLQIVRIAHARNIEPTEVRLLVELNTRRPPLGLFGPSTVNVLKLNLALDSISRQ